jgi:cytochrome c-type biogenesis protein CcmF
MLSVLGIAFAAGLAAASVAPLWKRNLKRTPLHIWGMVIAHLGIAVSLAGMAADSAFKTERLAAVHVGDNLARWDRSASRWSRCGRPWAPIGRRSRRG